MEYGQSERSEPDPVTEGSGEGGDSGVGESMFHMGLGEGGGGTGGVGGVGGGESSYPERPGEANCIYYMRTGFCGYGERCRFNHPRDRGEVTYGGGRAGGAGGDYPERDGQPVCQYYMRTGSCKFGSSCKYHHPRHDVGSATAVPLSIYGYPLRPGEKECTYYMKTGQCKFGVTCKFHHPLPAGVQLPTSTSNPAPGPTAITAPVVYPTGQSSATPTQYGIAAGSWQVARPPIVPGSYIQGPYGPMLLPTGVVPFGGWTPYPVSVSAVPAPSTGPAVEAGQLYGIPSTSRLSAKAPAYTGGTGPYPAISSSSSPSSSIQKESSYPERPGQPECQHYLRTGECKYGPSCRYHHPAQRTAQRESFSLTPLGLPSRPGAAPCSFFVQHGICKFGPTCKYNHPMGSLSYSPSTSSLSDMPIAPYPVGSSIVTLAPASSSSDLRTEVITGSNYNPTTIYASPNDNVLPKNGSDLQSGTQQPGQSSTTKGSPSRTSEQEDATRS